MVQQFYIFLQRLMKSVDDMIVQYEKDDNDSCYGDSCGYNS